MRFLSSRLSRILLRFPLSLTLGMAALGAAIARAVTAKREKRTRTGALARWSLVEIQLALVERTRAPSFDGAMEPVQAERVY